MASVVGVAADDQRSSRCRAACWRCTATSDARDADAQRRQRDTRAGFRGVTLALNCDSRDEVDAVFAEWVSAGAVPVKQPEAAFWGGYSSYVADPDGHLWEIAHNPYSPNDETGRMQLGD